MPPNLCCTTGHNLKYTLGYSLGILWELPEYTLGYSLGTPRVYPTSPDYAPSDSGWGIVWKIGYTVGDIIYDYNQL